MNPKILHVDYSVPLQQKVVGAGEGSEIPAAPSKVAELFKMFATAAQAVVVGGNVVATKTPPPPKVPQADPPPLLDSLQAFEVPQFDSVQAHDTLMKLEEQADAQAVAAEKLEAKAVAVVAALKKQETAQDEAQKVKAVLTPAAYEALKVAVLKATVPPAQADPPLPQWGASSAQKKLVYIDKQLGLLGFTHDLPAVLTQNGAPEAVVVSVCELVLNNVKKIAQAQAAPAQEVADAKKLVAQMQASKNDAVAQSSAWQSQHNAVLKELQTAQNTLAAWEHLHAGLQQELTKSEAKVAALQEHTFVPPTSVEGAFEGIAQAFRDVWKARAYYVEQAVAKLMEADEKEPPWPTMAVSWDVGYGCPGCSANKTMVGVSHPKQGNGYTCTKCKKTWKDPNAPKSQGKKGLFDRVTAVKTLVEELGYDLDMALYLVDTAGAQRVLHIAQQVPTVPAPYVAEFKAWAVEQNGDAPKKVESSPPAETLSSVKTWGDVTSENVQVLKYNPGALPGYHQTQFTADQVKIDALEASIKEEGLTSGLLAYNVHDEMIPLAALNEENPHLAKIASELLLQQQDAPESPLITAATPLEVTLYQPGQVTQYQPVATPINVIEYDSLDALALIPTMSKKKSK